VKHRRKRDKGEWRMLRVAAVRTAAERVLLVEEAAHQVPA
jgi:hypothetical protein